MKAMYLATFLFFYIFLFCFDREGKKNGKMNVFTPQGDILLRLWSYMWSTPYHWLFFLWLFVFSFVVMVFNIQQFYFLGNYEVISYISYPIVFGGGAHLASIVYQNMMTILREPTEVDESVKVKEFPTSQD